MVFGLNRYIYLLFLKGDVDRTQRRHNSLNWSISLSLLTYSSYYQLSILSFIAFSLPCFDFIVLSPSKSTNSPPLPLKTRRGMLICLYEFCNLEMRKKGLRRLGRPSLVINSKLWHNPHLVSCSQAYAQLLIYSKLLLRPPFIISFLFLNLFLWNIYNLLFFLIDIIFK